MLALQQNKNEAQAPVKVQPKLEVGKEDDAHEKEADQVADKVMRMSTGNGAENNTMHTGQPKAKPMSIPDKGKVQTMHTGKPVVQKMSIQNRNKVE